MACSIACVVAGYYFHLGNGGDGYGPRYYYTALGFFCLMGARGMQLTWRWLAGHPAHARWRGAVVVFVMGGIALGIGQVLPSTLKTYSGIVSARRHVYRMVEELGLRDAVVFVETDPPEYSGWYPRNHPRMAGNVLYARYLGSGAALKLLREGCPGRSGYVLSFEIGPGYPLAETVRLEPLTEAGPVAQGMQKSERTTAKGQ